MSAGFAVSPFSVAYSHAPPLPVLSPVPVGLKVFDGAAHTLGLFQATVPSVGEISHSFLST